MKKICISFIVLALALYVYIPVHAHPGRTDDSGGHVNHFTGQYHYHHGYPAHKHPGGVCPYSSGVKAATAPSPSPGARAAAPTERHDGAEGKGAGALLLLLPVAVAAVVAYDDHCKRKGKHK